MARIDKRINELTPSTEPLLGTDLVAIWATNGVPHTRHQTVDVITNFVNNALTGITSFDTFVTGSTLNLNTLVLGMNQGLPDLTVDLSPLITSNDSYVTGSTLNGNTLELGRNQGLSTLTVDLTSLITSNDSYVTGSTLNGNTLELSRNQGLSTLTTDLSSLIFTGNTSGNCITDLWVSNVHGCSPITVHDTIQSTTSTGSNTTQTIAFGSGTLASGDYSQAFGTSTTASGLNSHAEGGGTIASGDYSHAEGGSLLTSICTTFNETSETYVTPSYTLYATDGVSGYETFRLWLSGASATVSNLHMIYGNSGNTMDFPAAYQEGAPFGVDIGGTNPAFWAVIATSQYDSWLTIGPTDGTAGISSTPSNPLSSWTVGSGISFTDGGVYWISPIDGPSLSSLVCVAQITIPTGTLFDVRLNAQGKSVSGEDWYQEDIQFTNTTPYTPQSPLPSGRVCYNDNADTNDDGSVNSTDLLNLLSGWGTAFYTFYGDGTTGIEELQLVQNAKDKSVPMTPTTVVVGSPTIAGGLSSHAGGLGTVISGDYSFGHSYNSLITGTRSVVLGGSGITGTTDDTVYVPNLNIGTIGSGTPNFNLGIDSGGNVVTGATTPDFIVTGGTSSLSFSGGCITDLYVSNIHSCSPLHINPLDEGNILFGSQSGLIVDLGDAATGQTRVGINHAVNSYALAIGGDVFVEQGSLGIGEVPDPAHKVRVTLSDTDYLGGGNTGIRVDMSHGSAGVPFPTINAFYGMQIRNVPPKTFTGLTHQWGMASIMSSNVSATGNHLVVGGRFVATSLNADNYALQIEDGLEAAGKVLVCQPTHTYGQKGLASWGLVGSGGITSDTFVDNATLSGTTLVFDKNDNPNAFNVDLSSLDTGLYVGSGTVPTGTTASITDTLRFDGSSDGLLVLDGTNNRIGVGTGVNPLTYGVHLKNGDTFIENGNFSLGGATPLQGAKMLVTGSDTDYSLYPTLTGGALGVIGSWLSMGSATGNFTGISSRSLTTMTGAGTSTILGVDSHIQTTASGGAVKVVGGRFIAAATGNATNYALQLQDGTEGTVGHVWTSVDLYGEGHWGTVSSGGITSDTYVDNASLSGETIIFDKNSSPNAFSVDLAPILSGFTTGNTLAETLVLGNETLGNDIIMTSDIIIDESSGSEIRNLSGNSKIKLETPSYFPLSGAAVSPGALTGMSYSLFDGFPVPASLIAVGKPIKIINTQNGSNDGEFVVTAIEYAGGTNWVQWTGMTTELAAPYGEWSFSFNGMEFISSVIDPLGSKTASVYINPRGTFMRLNKGGFGQPGYLNGEVSIVDNTFADYGGTITYDSFPIVVAGINYTIRQGVVSSLVGPGRAADVKTDYALYTENIAFNRNGGGTETLVTADKTTNIDRLQTLQDKSGIIALTSDLTGFTGTQTLGQTLVLGKTTDGNDIVLSSGDTITSFSGDATLDLRDGDIDGQFKLSGNRVEIEGGSNYLNIDAGTFGTDSHYTNFIMGSSTGVALSLIKSDFSRFGGLVITQNDTTTSSTAAIANYPVFFAAQNGTIASGITNTAIIGGNGTIATESDTLYTDNLNIYTTPTVNNTITDIVVRDSDGSIRTRSLASITGITSTDNYVTGATMNGNTLELSRNGLTDVTVDLSQFVDSDTSVTGLTFNPTTYDLTLTQDNGKSNLVSNLAVLASDIFVLSGVYNMSTGIVEYTTNSGTTFEVSGFTSGMTDSYTSAANLNGNTIEFDNNIQGTNLYSVDLTSILGGNSPWTAGTGTNSAVLIGSNGTASGVLSVTQGIGNVSSGDYSHTEGGYYTDGETIYTLPTQATNYSTHAEGLGTLASGIMSHAEGWSTTASGEYSHSQGKDTTASAGGSHAEGFGSLASGNYSHAEGYITSATTHYAHAEGYRTEASGQYSHAENFYTTASGDASHAGGWSTNPLYRVESGGVGSFVHFGVFSETRSRGAYGTFSAILGGRDHNIDTGSSNSVILGGDSNIIISSVTNSVVLGGDSITGDTNDTVYVPNLNISTVGVGVSVGNLGIDTNGNVVTGTTGGGGTTGKYVESFNFTGATTSTITHNLGDEDVQVQVKDATGALITPNTVNNYTTNSVDINVSSTETMRVIIIG
jgi:hypothetical protein